MQKIRPLDVLNQIMSRTKRAKYFESENQKSNTRKRSKETSHFMIRKNQEQLKEKKKFCSIGKAYMSEYSKFQYKVDTIVNDAYLYVKTLKSPQKILKNTIN